MRKSILCSAVLIVLSHDFLFTESVMVERRIMSQVELIRMWYTQYRTQNFDPTYSFKNFQMDQCKPFCYRSSTTNRYIGSCRSKRNPAGCFYCRVTKNICALSRIISLLRADHGTSAFD